MELIREEALEQGIAQGIEQGLKQDNIPDERIIEKLKAKYGMTESLAKSHIQECRDAKKWLINNNFYYGQRSFFNYTPSFAKEWCHKNDQSWEYIDVSLEKYRGLNQYSRYKNFIPEKAPWDQ